MSEERAPKLPPQVEALLSEMTPEDRAACLEFAWELEKILKMIIQGTGRQIAILQKQLQEAKTGSVATYNEAFNAGVDATIAAARSHDHPEQLISDLTEAKRV